jgi:hypothetical protein
MGETFITAKYWRGLGTDDVLKSIEVAARVLEDRSSMEAPDEPSAVGRVMQLLDMSAQFQEMAITALKGARERFVHR